MVLIAVHGSATRFLPAERGTVHLSLEFEGADRAAAVDRVTTLHERFRGEAQGFVEGGAATRWTSDRVWVRAEDRSEGRDERRTRVHVATAKVQVRFRDFTALSAWLVEAGSVEGVGIERIEWALTRDHEAEAVRALRVEAVQDAIARAEAYASAIGGSGVELRTMWEEGLRPAGGTSEGRWTAQAMGRRTPAIELRPDDIELTARVTADFEVDVAR